MRALPRVVAHRGASCEAPENTAAAFQRAVAVGARAIELDVHLSADHVPVVIHDADVDRTTDGTGAVADLDVERLQSLDAGRWFDASFAGERVPTLAEALAFARDHDVDLNIELKSADGAPASLGPAVAAAVDVAGMAERVFVTSFDPVAVERYRQAQPDAGVGVIVLGQPTPDALKDYARFADAIGVYVSCATPEVIMAARMVGLAVVAWTVNDGPVAQELFARGIDGIITDDPRAMVPLFP